MLKSLELQKIRKSYPLLPVPVLGGVDLVIRPGQRLVVLGASGSGKTTLLHVLGLLLRPDGGKMLLDGCDAQAWSERRRAWWRNRHLGYVFQDFGLIPELTLVENIELPLRIGGAQSTGSSGKKFLARLGLGGRENSFPSEISGGESQRVAIARALVGNPTLVLADEPTGNLQKGQAEEIADLFKELQNELGFALVVATHNESFAAALDAQLLWLSSGFLLLEEEGKK